MLNFEGSAKTQLNVEQPRLNRGPGRLQPHWCLRVVVGCRLRTVTANTLHSVCIGFSSS